MEQKPMLQKDGVSEPIENEYYLRVSKKLRNVKYLMLLLMVASLIFTLWAYRSRLTYNNFRYLFRDIDEAGHTSLNTDSVFYSANDTNNYLYFRGDLAVASSSGVAFHRALGSRSFEDNIRFKSPIICGSKKYMIAYDSGGNRFYVYNSISRVYDEILNHAIIDAAASDSGHFAVLTSNDVGDRLVRVYDKDFNLVGEITRDGYAYAIGFFEDGRLYICECNESNASIFTELSLYTVGAENIDVSVNADGLVYDTVKTDDGFLALSDAGVAFYDKNNVLTDYFSFGTAKLLYGDISGSAAAVLLDKNEIGKQSALQIYYAGGETLEVSAESGARGVVLCGEKACALYDGYLFVCDKDASYTLEIPEGGRYIMAMNNTSVLVCYNDYAKVFEVKQ